MRYLIALVLLAIPSYTFYRLNARYMPNPKDEALRQSDRMFE